MALILAIPLAGCKKASKTEDPKAAKDYVFKYENLQINFPNNSGESYYDVTSVDVADGKGYAVTSTYDYETGENLSFLITVDPNTKSTDVNPLEKPDFSDKDTRHGSDTFPAYAPLTAWEGTGVLPPSLPGGRCPSAYR